MDTELNVKLNNTLNGTSLKAIQDKNGNDITDTYLPKTGGEVPCFVVNQQANNATLILNGGQNAATGKNPFLALYGRDVNSSWAVKDGVPGGFILNAGNTETNKQLRGLVDGRLLWTNNDLAGSAIVAKSMGTNGYVKYASGLIIQWGRVNTDPFTASGNGYVGHVNLNISLTTAAGSLIFTNFDRNIPEPISGKTLNISHGYIQTTSTIDLCCDNKGDWYVSWLVIGR